MYLGCIEIHVLSFFSKWNFILQKMFSLFPELLKFWSHTESSLPNGQDLLQEIISLLCVLVRQEDRIRGFALYDRLSAKGQHCFAFAFDPIPELRSLIDRRKMFRFRFGSGFGWRPGCRSSDRFLPDHRPDCQGCRWTSRMLAAGWTRAPSRRSNGHPWWSGEHWPWLTWRPPVWSPGWRWFCTWLAWPIPRMRLTSRWWMWFARWSLGSHLKGKKRHQIPEPASVMIKEKNLFEVSAVFGTRFRKKHCAHPHTINVKSQLSFLTNKPQLEKIAWGPFWN